MPVFKRLAAVQTLHRVIVNNLEHRFIGNDETNADQKSDIAYKNNERVTKQYCNSISRPGTDH